MWTDKQFWEKRIDNHGDKQAESVIKTLEVLYEYVYRSQNLYFQKQFSNENMTYEYKTWSITHKSTHNEPSRSSKLDGVICAGNKEIL